MEGADGECVPQEHWERRKAGPPPPFHPLYTRMLAFVCFLLRLAVSYREVKGKEKRKSKREEGKNEEEQLLIKPRIS